jgi:hypothetical protein
VSPALNTTSNAVHAVATTAGEVTGTGPLLPSATAGAFALIAALSGLWARHKSQVADQLAAGTAAAGPAAVNAAMSSAADSPKFAAIVELLNSHLATGQAPGQPTPAKGP